MPEASPALLSARGVVTDLGGGGNFLSGRRPQVRAVDHVDLYGRAGEIFGLVGESGCGKSTLARTLLGVQRESGGSIELEGRTVSGLEPRRARRIRAAVQYVHQDPGAALDPWWAIGPTLHEGLRVNGGKDAAERNRRIDAMLDAVGLDASFKKRYPHELSGGQQRRVGLARILVLQPRLVILDEPTAGLDLSVQASVLRLVRDLRERLGLALLFISHDLSVVRRMCDRVAIMYLGRIVEQAPVDAIFAAPRHPYTTALLGAAPRLADTEVPPPMLHGEPPRLGAIVSGCSFRTRCRYAETACAEAVPTLDPVAPAHTVRCRRWRELGAAAVGSDAA